MGSVALAVHDGITIFEVAAVREVFGVDRGLAARTGMGTAATLRRHFNRAIGVPPDTPPRRRVRPATTHEPSVGGQR
jgi:hypothetical protein